MEATIQQPQQIAVINNRPVYQDGEGNVSIETDDFSYLRELTAEENIELAKVFREFKNLVGQQP